jgi:hypothetical protein
LSYKYLRYETLDLHSNLGKPSSAKPSQAGSMENPSKASPAMCPKEDAGSVYFWKEASLDLFAAAPLTPQLLKYVELVIVDNKPSSKQHFEIMCACK